MTVQLYATNWCRDCRAAKQFLNAHGIQYTEIDVDAKAAGCWWKNFTCGWESLANKRLSLVQFIVDVR
ncbi:MAG: glutaredoxin family protein [Terracidiphilus sp.]